MTRDLSMVAVLVFDRSPLFEMSVPLSVFASDVSPATEHRYELQSVAAEDGALRTTGGLEIRAPYKLEALQNAGIVVVPAWRNPHERPGEPVLAALRAAHAGGAVIVGLCLGAFVVAAAGLLDGKRAATHWAFTGALAAAYPDVTVDAAALFVDEGDVLTSAGAAAGIDACLHLVRRTMGASTAAAIARRMVVPPQRSGSQAQYLDQPVPERVDDVMFGVLAHALEHLDSHLDVDAMAARAHMSRRDFDRKFRAAVGDSPMRWLLNQRVLHAQRLLEGTDLSIDAIARHVGLDAGVSLRPHFRRQVGTSPQAYRQAFRAIDASGRVT
jgi:transcriptional regulator GlxA family with amidase domain